MQQKEQQFPFKFQVQSVHVFAQNPTSINFYRDSGFLPNALVNYLCLMGWTMPDERELFDLDEMVEAFEETRLSVGGPIFDQQKLSWINGQYIRAMSDQDFVDQITNQIVNPEKIKDLAILLKDRIEKFTDVIGKIDYIVGERKTLEEADLDFPSLQRESVVRILYVASHSLETAKNWDKDEIFRSFTLAAKSLDVEFKKFMMPVFVAISGKKVSLPVFDSMILLGRDVSIHRMRSALDCLGVSGKMKKKLEKEIDYLS